MMQRISDESLRRLLGQFAVEGPDPGIIRETKRLMRREMAVAAEPAARGQAGLVLVMAGLSVLAACNFFYVLTVGSILKLMLPVTWAGVLNHSMIGMTLASAALVMSMCLVVFLKSFRTAPVRNGV